MKAPFTRPFAVQVGLLVGVATQLLAQPFPINRPVDVSFDSVSTPHRIRAAAIGLAARVLFMTSVFLACCALRASADVTYTYTGTPFTIFVGSYQCPPTCRVTGSFKVPEALPADTATFVEETYHDATFSFTDGSRTFSNSTVAFYSIYVITDVDGRIEMWDLLFRNQQDTGFLELNNFPGVDPQHIYPDISTQFGGFAETIDSPGTWSSPLGTSPDLMVTKIDPVQVVFPVSSDLSIPVDLVVGKSTAIRVEISVDLPAQLNGDVTVEGQIGTPPFPSIIVPKQELMDKGGHVTTIINPQFKPTASLTKVQVVADPQQLLHVKDRAHTIAARPVNAKAADLALTYYLLQCSRCPGYGSLSQTALNQTISDNNTVILATYPVPESFEAPYGGAIRGDTAGGMLGINADLNKLWLAKHLAGKNRALGIVPDGYFSYHGLSTSELEVAGFVVPSVHQAVGLVLAGTKTAAAHELGHTLGFPGGTSEEYYLQLPDCGQLDFVGARVLCRGRSASGYWVDQNVAIDPDLSQNDHFCFMGLESAGFLASNAADALSHVWVDTNHYASIFNQIVPGVSIDPPVLLFTAIVSTGGDIIPGPSYTLPDGTLTPSENGGTYSIQVLDSAGAILAETRQTPVFMAYVEPLGAITTTTTPLMAAVSFPANAATIAVGVNGRSVLKVNIVSKLLTDAINAIPSSGFDVNPTQRRNALLNQAAALERQLGSRNQMGAVQMLQNEIRPRLEDWLIDGYTTSSPLEYTKPAILALVDELIKRLDR